MNFRKKLLNVNKILCIHCKRTQYNNLSCIGKCVSPAHPHPSVWRRHPADAPHGNRVLFRRDQNHSGTKILHGNQAAQKAEQTAKETFASGGLGKNLPEIHVGRSTLLSGVKILDLLSNNNIFKSKSEARRAIKSNAIKINNKILIDENKIIEIDDFGKEEIMKISYGKKKHYVVKFN